MGFRKKIDEKSDESTESSWETSLGIGIIAK